MTGVVVRVDRWFHFLFLVAKRNSAQIIRYLPYEGQLCVLQPDRWPTIMLKETIAPRKAMLQNIFSILKIVKA